MKYSNIQIEELRLAVQKRISKKRFQHTVGVESMAIRIGEKCLPEMVDKLRVAALLHDISKEYSEAEHQNLMKKYNIIIDETEIAAPQLWHSITAPAAIKEEFPEFADDEILSAVYNHTVGSPDMTIFDEIILLSDYIEDGRTYKNCVELRESFINELVQLEDSEKAIIALHKAVAKSLDNNICEFVSRGQNYHMRTLLTRDAILAKIER